MQQLQAQLVVLQADLARLNHVQEQGLNALPRLVEVLQQRSRPTLIDTRGLGKPFAFNGREEDFQRWSAKVSNYVAAIFDGSEEVFKYAAEEEQPLTVAVTKEAFNEVDGTVQKVKDLDAMLAQRYTALLQLTEGEAHDIVVNADRNLGEAWRRLHRRCDPATGGRKRNLLRAILTPGRCALSEVQPSLERWEALVLRYERKVHRVLEDEIKLSGLEALVPEDVEKHLLLNGNRLDTYESARAEVVAYVEAKTGLKIKDAKPSLNPHSGADPNAMDVDSFIKGGKKGDGRKGKKGDGKESRSCYVCGRPGHLAKDCRSGTQSWSSSSWQSPPKGSGKKGDGKKGDGKKGKNGDGPKGYK